MLTKRNIFLVLPFIASLSYRAGLAQEPAGAPAADLPRRILPITEVMVYEDRALVTREGEVTLARAGVETIRIDGLPPALSETSLRAGLLDGSMGRVISVSSEIERRREIQDEKLRAAEEERRASARKIAEVDDELARIATREAYLGAYEKLVHRAVSERTGGGADPEVARWTEALRFSREGRTAALTARRDAERRKEALARVQADLDAEALRLRRPEERSERSAEVALEATGAGPARLRLSYVIEGAGWTPRYDARHDAARGELAVTYFGEVRQRTGEDWSGTRLILSTARPSVGASRPEVLPLRFSAGPIPEAAKGKGIEHRRLAQNAVDAVHDFAPGEVTGAAGIAELLVAETRENATSATFTVPGTASIIADGRPHKVPITTFRERAETSFETVPRLERFVYLKCAARNASPYPMLAGAIDIFRGSGFMGTSRLKFTAPGRPFEVSLGIEEALKVRRAVTAAGPTGRAREERHGYDIEVANFGETARGVTVIESYPISDIEEVTVRLEETSGAVLDEKAGRLRWRLELPPGEARKVHLEYTIHYPR